jgi:hypothetical protein
MCSPTVSTYNCIIKFPREWKRCCTILTLEITKLRPLLRGDIQFENTLSNILNGLSNFLSGSCNGTSFRVAE